MIDQAGDFVLGVLKGYGAPGAVIVVLGWVIWVLARKYDSAQATLLDSWKEQADIAKNDAVVLANFAATSEARNRLADASVRSQELATAAQISVAANVQLLISEVRELRGEQQRMLQDNARRGGAT